MISVYVICKVEISLYYYSNILIIRLEYYILLRQINKRKINKRVFMGKDMIVFAISKLLELGKIKE